MTTITYDIHHKYESKIRTVSVNDDNPTGKEIIAVFDANNAMKIGGEYAGCIVKQIIIIHPTTEA